MVKEEIATLVETPVPFTDFEALKLALGEDAAADTQLESVAHIADDQPQDREGCCGTMTLPENNGVDAALEEEKRVFLETLTADLEGRTKTFTETK